MIVKPPSPELVEASRRLAAKIKRDNALYTLRLDLAHEYGLQGDPELDTLFDQALARAQGSIYDARQAFRELVTRIS